MPPARGTRGKGPKAAEGEAQPVTLPPLGSHMSIAGGVQRAIERALAVEATALQLFLKNNNQWRGKPLLDEEVEAFRAALAAARAAGPFATPIAHATYLINLATPAAELAELSRATLADELQRAGRLGVAGVVVHPGAHMGTGEAAGIAAIAARCNRVLELAAASPALLLLETTAGQGSSLGHRFEQLAAMIAGIEDRARVAVCLDTCHVFAAGYDIGTAEGARAMLREFEGTIGLDRLAAIHINDSAKPLGSHVDRHAHIGQGLIPGAGLAALLTDPRLARVPFILETPKGPDLAEDRMNLAALRTLARSAPPPGH